MPDDPPAKNTERSIEPCLANDRGRPTERPNHKAAGKKSPEGAHFPRTAVLVEFRDEVFARLRTDLRALGTRVVRAYAMRDAYDHCDRVHVDLLIVNVDRTDEASWLRARQLHLRFPGVELWIVTSWSSSVDETLASFVNASQVIYYPDLWRLADEIRNRVDEQESVLDIPPPGSADSSLHAA